MKATLHTTLHTAAGGGVIHLENITNVNIYTDQFLNNLGSKKGGAVHAYDVSLNVKHSVFVNSMGSFGGAIALIDCNIFNEAV